VGGATLVATDFGVAFQADLGFAGVRLGAAQGGTLPAQSFNLTANFTAEGNFGPGMAFDGAWIGTGFNNATAVSGLLRADAAGGITTLYPSSPNLGAAVAGLGREVVFGETTDAVNDILIHDIDTGATRTLLADHLIGSAATIGGRIIFSALDRSDPLNFDVDQTNDIWSLYSYQSGAVTFLADLPNGNSGRVGDDPIVPFADAGQSFFGQGDRIFWKQLNDADTAGVELHSIDLAAADIPGSLTLYDIAPGAVSGGDFNEAVFLDGRFYFTAATDGSFQQAQLYATDGSAPPVAVTGPDLATAFAFPFNLTAVGDEFFFTATDAATGRQRIFQLEDGGTTATRLALPDITGVVIELADLGDQLGVIAFEAGIDQVFVFTPGAQPGDESSASQLTSFSQSGGISSLTLGGDDEFYFTRSTASEGRELWVIDSTAAEGARLLADVNLTPVPVGYQPEQVEASPVWF
jgi:ELWxxDGT repeat protein